MAGDWIKIECATPNKPEVFEIADIIGIDPDEALGKLIRVWVWADEQTIDGNAASVTKALLNRVTGCAKFTDAMIQVGWLAEQDGKVSFTNFGRHNGKTAKTRALGRKRTDAHRSCNDSVTQDDKKSNGRSVTKALPEKRREEKSIRNNTTREVPVHDSDLNIPASVNTPECRASMDRLFSAMNKRRADSGEYNLGDFALQANWNIAAQIGPDRLASVVEMAIAREWRSLVVPDDVGPKSRQRSPARDAEDYTADEEILWAQIAAACKDTSPEGDRSRKAFDKLTKEIMTQIGGSAAIRELNLGEKPEREMKKRFILTRRGRLKLESQEVR